MVHYITYLRAIEHFPLKWKDASYGKLVNPGVNLFTKSWPLLGIVYFYTQLLVGWDDENQPLFLVRSSLYSLRIDTHIWSFIHDPR